MKVKIFYEYDEPTNRYGYCKVPLEKGLMTLLKIKRLLTLSIKQI